MHRPSPPRGDAAPASPVYAPHKYDNNMQFVDMCDASDAKLVLQARVRGGNWYFVGNRACGTLFKITLAHQLAMTDSVSSPVLASMLS